MCYATWRGVRGGAFGFDTSRTPEMRQRKNSKDREFAKLVKLYAKATGASLRTAQRHAAAKPGQAGFEDWQSFMQDTATGLVTQSEKEAPSEEAVTALAEMSPLNPARLEEADFLLMDDSELSDPEKLVKSLYTMALEHFRLWKENIRKAPDLAGYHAGVLLKIRQDYKKASDELHQWKLKERRVIPISEFSAFLSEFVIPLANILQSLEVELAVAVNPRDPAHARSEIIAFKEQRLQPQVASLIESLETYVAKQAA